jgi:hypothetical protein
MKFASISALGLAMASNASIAFSLSICKAHFLEEESDVSCVSGLAMPTRLSDEQRLVSTYINGLPLEGNKLKGFVGMGSNWMKAGKSIVCPSLPFSSSTSLVSP